jgi:hypothetical protein
MENGWEFTFAPTETAEVCIPPKRDECKIGLGLPGKPMQLALGLRFLKSEDVEL